MKKLIVSIFVTSCIFWLSSTGAGEQVDPDMGLLQADKDFALLSERTDPKTAFAAYLAPDAMMIPRHGDPIVGFDNAIASFGEEQGYELLWQPQLAEVTGSGEMGWTWGLYQVIVEGEQVSSGKYVNIWVKQPDGNWKVRMDMGNQEPAQKSSDENE